MKIKLLVPLLISLVSAQIGVAAERIINDRSDIVTNPVQLGEVVFISPQLNRTKTNHGIFASSRHSVIRLSVEQAYMSELASGYKSVTGLFRNHTDFDQFIEVRAQFYDEAFRVTEQFSRWKRFFIPANGTEVYTENSINPATSSYRLEVRESE